MNRKVLSIFGAALLILTVTGCSSHPEKGLLDRYFNALALKDLQTLSTMAVDPVSFEFNSYELVSVSEETVTTFDLADLNQKELDLKKQVEESVGVTLDSRAELDDAVYERDNARSSAGRRAAQKKVDEMQAAYDEQYAKHQDLQKEYNAAKEAASREESIATFSLGGEYTNIREFTGEVFAKDCEVTVNLKDGGVSNYKILLKRYVLKDEAMNMTHRGRWIIHKFEKLN